MRIILLFILAIAGLYPNAQKTDKKLQHQLEKLVTGFRGDIGIYVKDLRTGKTCSINADTIFPTASIVKVPILIGIMDKVNRGDLKFDQLFTYRDSLLYAGVDILGSFKQDEKITLAKLLMLMLTVSDNTASLWLQSLAGTGSRINEIMDSLGYANTRVNSRTPGREHYRTQYGWGQTTPAEMASIFERISKGEIISRAASDEMLRQLSRNHFDDESISQIPPYVTVFSKNGAVNQSRSEVVLVIGKKAHYVFTILTKNNVDQSWKDDNEAWVLTRKISKLLWEHYEPRDKWEPASGGNNFK